MQMVAATLEERAEQGVATLSQLHAWFDDAARKARRTYLLPESPAGLLAHAAAAVASFFRLKVRLLPYSLSMASTPFTRVRIVR